MDSIRITENQFKELRRKSSTKWNHPITLSMDKKGLFYPESKGYNRINRKRLDKEKYPFLLRIEERNHGYNRIHITRNNVFYAGTREILFKVIIINDNLSSNNKGEDL